LTVFEDFLPALKDAVIRPLCSKL